MDWVRHPAMNSISELRCVWGPKEKNKKGNKEKLKTKNLPQWPSPNRKMDPKMAPTRQPQRNKTNTLTAPYPPLLTSRLDFPIKDSFLKEANTR